MYIHIYIYIYINIYIYERFIGVTILEESARNFYNKINMALLIKWTSPLAPFGIMEAL